MLQLPRDFNKLTEVVNTHLDSSRKYEVNTIKDVNKRFKLSLHDSKVLPDLRADFIDIKAGNSYEILVAPTLTRVF